jgi:hypothetical protein
MTNTIVPDEQELTAEDCLRYLADHPEIRAAVPDWADDIEIEEIDSDLEGTIFSFTSHFGEVELYGVGRLQDGEVRILESLYPSLYQPTERGLKSASDLRTLAADLTVAANRLEAWEAGR